MGVISAEGLYAGHPDIGDVCVGYEVEFCCDCCGAERDKSELYDVDGEMLCRDCVVGNLDVYDINESPVYDEDGDVINYCVCCGAEDKDLYMVDNEVCCAECACDSSYNKITDADIEAALERYFDRY